MTNTTSNRPPGWWQASDGNWYPPANGGQSPVPQQLVIVNTQRRRRWPWIVAVLVGIVVLIGVISAAAGGSNSTTSKPFTGTPSHPVANDVSITSCSLEDVGYPQAGVSVVNHSTGTSNYSYQVNFLQNGTVVAQGYGAVNSIAAGQRAADKVIGLSSNLSGQISCQLTGLTRMASS